jgi:hypothetical protein
MTKDLEAEGRLPVDRANGAKDIGTSRRLAVDRVFRGGILGTLGVAATIATDVLLHTGISMPLPGQLILVGAGTLAAGIGFTLVGRALPHLRRFGGRRGVQLFGAAGAFGLSAVVRGVTSVVSGIAGGWTNPLVLLADLAAAGMVVAGIAMIVIYVAGVVFGWREAEPMEDLG